MEIILSIVTIIIYFKLFMKAGESPIYALIPVLNLYTLCRIVDAAWAFWVYVVAIISAIMALLSGMTEMVTLIYLVILVIDIIIYARLYFASRDDKIWVIVLIIIEILRFILP